MPVNPAGPWPNREGDQRNHHAHVLTTKGGREGSSEDIKDRLAQIMERDQGREASEQVERHKEKRERVKDRLSSLLDRSKPVEIDKEQDECDLDKDHEIERSIDHGKGHSL